MSIELRDLDEDAGMPGGVRCLEAVRDGKSVGRVGYGARQGFAGVAGTTGYVGWYAAADEASGAALLREAARRLLDAGADRVVGPMDGSTWHRYRVTLPRAAEIEDGGAFLSEPVNPADWPAHFAAAGFQPLLEYETRRVLRPRPAPALESKRAELAARGVRLRPLALGRYDAELEALFALSLDAFAGNPFYTPIPLGEFRQLYAPLRPLLDPELVRLAHDDRGRLLGYVFAFPDTLAVPSRPRIVLKTLAVAPDVHGWGLGAVLSDEIHAAAAGRGASVLHALMLVSNASRVISARSDSELFRGYRLYGMDAR